MGTIRISGIDSLGKIQSEVIKIDANLFTKAVPSGGSDVTVQGNIMGKTRSITLRGRFIGTEADQKVFVDNVEAWMNIPGFLKFQANRTFTDSFGNDYVVLCSSFRRERVKGETGDIVYTMELKEGLTISRILLGTPVA